MASLSAWVFSSPAFKNSNFEHFQMINFRRFLRIVTPLWAVKNLQDGALITCTCRECEIIAYLGLKIDFFRLKICLKKLGSAWG
jgi:hypothetical protein